MKRFLSPIAVLASLVALAVASCPPPVGGAYYCSDFGITPGQGGWVANGDGYAWTCCNLNYWCPTNGKNGGYRFAKVAAGYSNGSATCYDSQNPANVYPDPAQCCAPAPIEP